MKIVINSCYGGFSVNEAVYNELGLKWDDYGYLDNEDFGIESDKIQEYRKHPPLIAAIEKLGEKESSGGLAKLQIIDIPNDVDWFIDEYDGYESIHEVHRTWP